MSPSRSHSPSSMNPDQAQEHRVLRTAAAGRERALGPGAAGLAARGGRSRPPVRLLSGWLAGLLCPGLRAAVGCGGHKLSERTAHPCAGLAGCGLFSLCTTPSPPRPPEGLELPRQGL